MIGKANDRLVRHALVPTNRRIGEHSGSMSEANPPA
jgi:hypothetical protein